MQFACPSFFSSISLLFVKKILGKQQNYNSCFQLVAARWQKVVCMYMYLYMYLHVHVNVYVYIYIYIFVNAHVHVGVHVQMPRSSASGRFTGG